MKRILYISALLIGLIFVSCRKEDIRPTDRSVTPNMPECVDKAKSGPGTSDTGAGSGDSDDGGITDPNDDEEIHNSKGK